MDADSSINDDNHIDVPENTFHDGDHGELDDSRFMASPLRRKSTTNRLYESALKRLDRIDSMHETHLHPECTFQPNVRRGSLSPKTRDAPKNKEDIDKIVDRLHGLGGIKRFQPEDSPEVTFRPELNAYSQKLAQGRSRSVGGKQASVYDSLYAEADRRLQRMEERLKSPDPSAPFTPTITKKGRRVSVADSKRRLLRSFSDLEEKNITARELREQKLKEEEDKKNKASAKDCTFQPRLFTRSKSAKDRERSTPDAGQGPAFIRLYARRNNASERQASLKKQQEEKELREATFKPKLFTKQGAGLRSRTSTADGSEPFHDRLYKRAMDRRESRSASIRQELEKECTFKPTLQTKSATPPEKTGGDGTNVHDRLYKQSLAQQVKLKERQNEKKGVDMSECTFQPNLEEARRSVTRRKSSKPLYELEEGGEQVWERLSQDKRDIFRKREEAKVKAEQDQCPFKPSLGPEPSLRLSESSDPGEIRRLQSSGSMDISNASSRSISQLMAPTASFKAKVTANLNPERDPFELRSSGNSPVSTRSRAGTSTSRSQILEPENGNVSPGFGSNVEESFDADGGSTPPPGPMKKSVSRRRSTSNKRAGEKKHSQMAAMSRQSSAGSSFPKPIKKSASKSKANSKSAGVQKESQPVKKPISVDPENHVLENAPITNSPISVPKNASTSKPGLVNAPEPSPITANLPAPSPIVANDPKMPPETTSVDSNEEASRRLADLTSQFQALSKTYEDASTPDREKAATSFEEAKSAYRDAVQLAESPSSDVAGLLIRLDKAAQKMDDVNNSLKGEKPKETNTRLAELTSQFQALSKTFEDASTPDREKAATSFEEAKSAYHEAIQLAESPSSDVAGLLVRLDKAAQKMDAANNSLKREKPKKAGTQSTQRNTTPVRSSSSNAPASLRGGGGQRRKNTPMKPTTTPAKETPESSENPSSLRGGGGQRKANTPMQSTTTPAKETPKSSETPSSLRGGGGQRRKNSPMKATITPENETPESSENSTSLRGGGGQRSKNSPMRATITPAKETPESSENSSSIELGQSSDKKFSLPTPIRTKPLASSTGASETTPRNATGEPITGVPGSSETPTRSRLRPSPKNWSQGSRAISPPKEPIPQYENFKELRDDWEEKASVSKEDGSTPRATPTSSAKPAPEETTSNGGSAENGDIVDRLKRMMSAIDSSKERSEKVIKKTSSISSISGTEEDKSKRSPRSPKKENEPEKWVDNMTSKIDNI